MACHIPSPTSTHTSRVSYKDDELRSACRSTTRESYSNAHNHPIARLRSLLSRGDSGDARSLSDLSRELTARNCTIEAIRVILKHLDGDLVPKIEVGDHTRMPHTDHVNCALPCIATLPTMMLACRHNPTLESMVVPELVNAVDGICLWANFFLHFGLWFPGRTTPSSDLTGAFFKQTVGLWALANIDPQICDTMRSTPVFVTLMLRLWITKGRDGQQFMYVEENQCPILNLMLSATQDPTSTFTFSHSLADLILSRGSRFTLDFARTVITRARRLTQLRVTPTHSTWFIDAIVRIADRLGSASLQLRRAFVRTDYIYELCKTVNLVSIEVEKLAQPIEYMRRVH
ncbi:hypothetical protein NMY22_g3582 [Coprinellus aureogranulatus]|nr:hypothetical protein NMY22_g3582 [Coprinellus aureogranulatus]